MLASKSLMKQKQDKHNNKKSIAVYTGLFFVLMVAMLSIYFIAEQSDIAVGQVAPADVQATRYMTIEDKIATEAKENLALEGFHGVYRLDFGDYNEKTLEQISDFFAFLEKTVASEAEPEEKIAALQKNLSIDLEEQDWQNLAEMSEGQVEALHDTAVGIVSEVMMNNNNGVLADDLAQAKEKILTLSQARNQGTAANVLHALLDSVEYYPTLVYDEEASEAERNEIIASVAPVYRTILKGEMIVSKGEIITAEQYEILYLLGYTDQKAPVRITFGIGLLVLVFMGAVWCYLYCFDREIYRDIRYLLILMVVILISTALFECIASVTVSASAEKAAQIGYLLPTAMGTMLIATLLNTPLAVIVGLILSALVGLLTGEINFVIVSILSGMVGVIGMSYISQRSDLSKTAFAISITNVVAVFALENMENIAIEVTLMGILFGFLNGIFSTIFTLGILPFLENLFGVTTSIKLLELSNSNQPLIKKLMLEAPGTYHHCVMVGNLGEAAADAIGANGLVVRVGAYYHDIGKTKRPYFFAENQFNGENPHEKISPTLSTLIVTSHVKDGIEMANEAKLPPLIVDMIAQHHGNSLVSFFYHKAKESEEEVREEDYRYDQKKPQTKEAAILMLADTVEAAIRSKQDATPGQLEGFVRTLIKNKLNDGQFDECDLTFKDLDQIAVAFCRVINGIYHKRIEYPDLKILKDTGKNKTPRKKD